MDAVTGISGEIHTHGRVERLGGFHQSEISGRFHLVVLPWQQAIHAFGNRTRHRQVESRQRAAHRSRDLDRDGGRIVSTSANHHRESSSPSPLDWASIDRASSWLETTPFDSKFRCVFIVLVLTTHLIIWTESLRIRNNQPRTSPATGVHAPSRRQPAKPRLKSKSLRNRKN